MQPIVDSVMSSYLHLGQGLYNSTLNLSLSDIHTHLRLFLVHLRFTPILLSFHCLNTALLTHSLLPPDVYWLKSLVLTFLTAFIGATLASLLSGIPAPPFTSNSDSIFLCTFLFWYIVHKSSLFRFLCNLRPIRAVIAFAATAARMRAMMTFIDVYVVTFPNVTAGAIICGGLAASAGVLLTSVEKIVQMGLHTPFELSKPGWPFKSAFLAASLYFILLNPNGNLPVQTLALDHDSVMFFTSLAFCVHAALDALCGKHINFLYWFETVLLAVTGLAPPQPPTIVKIYSSDKAAGGASHNGQQRKDVNQNALKSHGVVPDSPASCISDASDFDVHRPHIMDSGLRRRRS